MTVSKIKKNWERQKSNNNICTLKYMGFLFYYSPCISPRRYTGTHNWGKNILFLFIFYKFINIPFLVFLLRYFHFLKTTHAHYFFVLRMINYYCALVNFNTF